MVISVQVADPDHSQVLKHFTKFFGLENSL
jgi:hypothetical protein